MAGGCRTYLFNAVQITIFRSSRAATTTGINNSSATGVTRQFCPADANEDGVVDTRDVLEFLSWWAAGDPHADMIHDGKINTLDLIAFLALWNDPCL